MRSHILRPGAIAGRGCGAFEFAALRAAGALATGTGTGAGGGRSGGLIAQLITKWTTTAAVNT